MIGGMCMCVHVCDITGYVCVCLCVCVSVYCQGGECVCKRVCVRQGEPHSSES